MVGPTVGMTTLPSGNKWRAYSGSVGQFASIPAFVELVVIQNTGLSDSYVKIIPFFGKPTTTAAGDALGLEVILDGTTIYESQNGTSGTAFEAQQKIIELFIPKQSKLEIQSVNTANNTLQNRGVCVLGWTI